MINSALLVIFGLAAVPLLVLLARGKFNYRTPGEVSASELARVPRWARILVEHHNLLKFTSGGATTAGVFLLKLIRHKNVYADYILIVMCICSGAVLIACLLWRDIAKLGD